MRLIAGMAALAVLLMSGATVHASVPGTISFQGRLTDAIGQPLDTTIDITFTLFDDSSGGSQLWQETAKDVVIKEGIFEVLLGVSTPLNRTLFKDSGGWLQLTVGSGSPSATRLPFATNAYAFRAQYADTAGRSGYADTAGFALGMGSSGWADDGVTVRLTNSSDKVGVGIAVPEDKVHVANSTSGGTAFLRLETNHATQWGETGLRFETPQNMWHFRMDDYTNNNLPEGALALRSQDIGAEVMTWTGEGRVGIGTTLPEYPLDVRSTAVAIYGRTTGSVGVAGVYGRAEVDGYGVMGTSTSGRGVYGASTNGFGGYFLGPTSYVSGNLGIGTETPTHKLTVNGSAAIQSSGTTKYHVGYYNGGLDFSETTVADYRLMLKDGGNVGIGTGTPTAKLHVMGNVKVRDTLTAGAIFSTSIVDEMGVASAAVYPAMTCTDSWQDYLSRTMRVPGPGWVLVFGTTKASLNHPGSGSTDVYVCPSQSPTSGDDSYNAAFSLPGAAVAGFYRVTLNPMKLFRTDTAGVYTFYLNARSADGEVYVYSAGMHCFYIPTAYSYDAAAADMPGVDVAQPARVDLPAMTPSRSDDVSEVQILRDELAALRQEVEAMKRERE